MEGGGEEIQDSQGCTEKLYLKTKQKPTKPKTIYILIRVIYISCCEAFLTHSTKCSMWPLLSCFLHWGLGGSISLFDGKSSYASIILSLVSKGSCCHSQ